MNVLYLICGLIMLLASGDALVRGAVVLGLRLNISALLISLTVVAFGTSAPELVVGVKAVLAGSGGLALGNVVGSNTANMLFILGIPALLIPIVMNSREEKINYAIMISTAVILIALSLDNVIGGFDTFIILSIFTGVIGYFSYSAIRQRRIDPESVNNVLDEEIDAEDTAMSAGRIAFFVIGGLVGLVLGSEFLVKGATGIARSMSVSEEIIGLTIVAFGTSLPELGTTVSAARRGRGDIIVGNIIGSNIFNTVGILGVATIFGAIPVEETFFKLDYWVMLGAILMIAPFIYLNKPLHKSGGIVLVLAYGAYIYTLAQGSL